MLRSYYEKVECVEFHKRFKEVTKTKKELDIRKFTGYKKCWNSFVMTDVKFYFEIQAKLREAVHRGRPRSCIITRSRSGISWPKVDIWNGPSIIFARFGPVRILSTPETEDRFEWPPIFRHCRNSGKCEDHPEDEFQKCSEHWNSNPLSVIMSKESTSKVTKTISIWVRLLLENSENLIVETCRTGSTACSHTTNKLQALHHIRWLIIMIMCSLNGHGSSNSQA